MRRASFVGKIILWIFLIAIAIGGASTGYYFYQKYQEVKKNPEIITRDETGWLVDKVGDLMTLPADEVPTIATVIDKDKIKDQPFFENTENGDKVLVYVKAKKAILYRPSSDKIIEVGPVNSDQTADGISSNVRVAYLNGSENGDTDKMVAGTETKVKEFINNSETVSKENAKKIYTKSKVIDLSAGIYEDAVKQIADSIDGEVTVLPDGESKPDANILIILAE